MFHEEVWLINDHAYIKVLYLPAQSINPINLEENWPISIHSSILFHIEVMSWQWHDWCHFTQLRLGALIDSLQKTLDRSIHLIPSWWLCQPIFFDIVRYIAYNYMRNLFSQNQNNNWCGLALFYYFKWDTFCQMI